MKNIALLSLSVSMPYTLVAWNMYNTKYSKTQDIWYI